MASEPNLRDLFRGDGPALPEVDAAAVIRRSKRRRLPVQLAVGGTFVLAIGGLGVAGLQALGGSHTAISNVSTMSGGESTGDRAPADGRGAESAQGLEGGGAIKRAPADRINLCGGPVAEVAPNERGLVLAVDFPSSPVGTAQVMGTATLTNTGTEPVTGFTSPSPAITLSQGGTVLWHSNGPTDLSLVSVDLVPGASVDYQASMTPVRCGVEDDVAGAFRTDLPALEAGTYELSALIDFTADPSMEQEISELDLVSGPVATVRLD